MSLETNVHEVSSSIDVGDDTTQLTTGLAVPSTESLEIEPTPGIASGQLLVKGLILVGAATLLAATVANAEGAVEYDASSIASIHGVDANEIVHDEIRVVAGHAIERIAEFGIHEQVIGIHESAIDNFDGFDARSIADSGRIGIAADIFGDFDVIHGIDAPIWIAGADIHGAIFPECVDIAPHVIGVGR